MLLPEVCAPTPEDEVPVGARGVRISWLFDFLRSVEDAFIDLADRHQSHEGAYEHLNRHGHIPPAAPRRFDRHQPLTGHLLQAVVIKPLTQRSQKALFSRIPPEARGTSQVFLSHAWNTPLARAPGTTLTDVTTGNNPVSERAFCWIDLFVYNQHVAQDIARDMERIIGGIGTFAIPMTSAHVLGRLWCIWEWLSAYRAGAQIVSPEPANHSHYFGEKREWFSDTFTSVAAARTSFRADHDQIMAGILETFGSVEAADAELRRLADRSFTRREDAPYHRVVREPKKRG
jgi:hypothetical protein